MVEYIVLPPTGGICTTKDNYQMPLQVNKYNVNHLTPNIPGKNLLQE